MASATLNSKPVQMIVTLEDNALIADIKKALKLLRGVASVRMANLKDDETITPAMHRSINKARREYANGETISCSTPEEMHLQIHLNPNQNPIIQAEEHYNDK